MASFKIGIVRTQVHSKILNLHYFLILVRVACNCIAIFPEMRSTNPLPSYAKKPKLIRDCSFQTTNTPNTLQMCSTNGPDFKLIRDCICQTGYSTHTPHTLQTSSRSGIVVLKPDTPQMFYMCSTYAPDFPVTDDRGQGPQRSRMPAVQQRHHTKARL